MSRLAGYPPPAAWPWHLPERAVSVAGMTSRRRPSPATNSARVERLVERAMAFAVEEFDDDLAVARWAWLAHDDQAALVGLPRFDGQGRWLGQAA
jgi:uncharacterized protein YfaQ (DUF2300 family)